MAAKAYLSLNARPRAIVQVMDQMDADVRRAQRQWSGLFLLLFALGIIGLLFLMVDQATPYSGGGFACMGFLFWAGGAALLVWLLARRVSLPKEQLGVAREVLFTLRDDVSRRGRVTGWLDLTGPRQHSKLARTGRTRSGRTKYYYRDPWFQVKIKLADGNLLRLTLIERIKVKKGYVADRRHQLKARLAVNPSLYEIGPGERLPGLQVQDHILTLQVQQSQPFSAQEVLGLLKGMYSHLQMQPGRKLPAEPPA